MDQTYGLDPLGSLSPLPMYGGPSSSCLNHLAATGIRLDAEPFLNSLSQVYKDEFTTAVSVAVLRYRDQLLELEQSFPPQVEASLQGNTLCFVDHLFEVMFLYGGFPSCTCGCSALFVSLRSALCVCARFVVALCW